MKSFILPIATAMVLLVLGSCQEIEYREVEKLIRDTVKVKEFVDRYYAGTDTVTITQVVEVPVPTRSQSDTVIQYVYDTVYLQRVDTVWITTTTTNYDTIVVRERIYGDTLFQYIFARGAFGLPTELEEQYGEFFAEVDRRGITYQGSGSALLIAYRPMDDALQAYSFEYGNQIGLFINDKLTVDESYIPLFRELSRIFLKNEYSLDDSNPMSQRFPSDLIRWSNRSEYGSEIDKIFL